MRFEDFITKGLVKRSSIDTGLIKSILSTADNDLKFFSELEVNDVSARKIFSNFYDIFRSLLEAKALLGGYKVYSHEAFTYLLKENGEEGMSIKFDRFRRLRNKVNYYGGNMDIEEVNEYKAELIGLIEKIRKELCENVKN
jgi:hypothetical protein